MENKLISEYKDPIGGVTWSRKMRTLFRRLDATGKGYLMVDDILELVTDILNVFPKMETFENDVFVNSMVNFWYEVIAAHGDESSKTSSMINQDKFLENMKKSMNGQFKEEFADKFVEPLFNSADNDKDGIISSMEFRNLFTGLRAPKNDCEGVFKIYAKASKMDKETFHKVLADFFASDNIKSPACKLFGPMVNYKTAAEYPEVQFSPVWEGKMRTMFRRLDISQTGILRCHNFIQIARSIAQRNHLDKRRSTEVMKCMLNIWVKFIAVDSGVFETGKAGKHFSQLNEREFVQNLRQMVNGDFRHEIDQFGWTFFKAVESDGDGYLKMSEYRSLQESWNVGREEAEGMFKVLDRDKDNMISADEYLNAWVEYFLGEDQSSPYKAFFGPVIIRHQDNRTQFDDGNGEE